MNRRRFPIRSLMPWLLLLALVPFLGKLLDAPDKEEVPAKMPPMLVMVQSLGELHTARYNYENVFEYQTFRKPAPWVGMMPGGASLVRSATRNSALVSVGGSVEAGVDLRKARVESSPAGKTTVVLPSPVVYRPAVEARLHTLKVGAFWADPNIALKAEKDAATRFRAAAIEQGILRRASEEASARVRDLLARGGVREIEIRIDGDPA